MRIAYDAKRAYHNFTGLGNYSRTLLRTLATYYPNNEYHLFTPKSADNQRINVLKQFNNIIEHTPSTIFYQKMRSLWRSYGIINDLKKQDFKIFHGLSNELPEGLASNGIKSIVTIHDLIFERYPTFYPFFDRQMYHWKFKRACQQADIVVAISNQTKADIIEFYNINEAKIKIIYQSCEPQFFEPLSNESIAFVKQQYQLPDNFILYVGTVNERKNLLGLIKTMQLLTHDNINLVAVGDGGDYYKKVKEFINNNNLAQRICLIPKIDFRDLPAFYQLGKIFVLPSYFEGFGIPIIEALASGTPVITSTGSCFPEAGGPNSLYCAPDNHTQRAELISKILNDPILSNSMIQSGKVYVQRFREDHIAKQWIEIYNNI